VNPGGFAFGATDFRAVRLELQSTLTGILIDIAEEAESFDTFKANVEQFFWQTDDGTAGEWDACVREVQSGRMPSPPGLLPVFPATSPLVVSVTLKPTDAVTPKDNSTPEPVLASAA
jgi:hypothetical protein